MRERRHAQATRWDVSSQSFEIIELFLAFYVDAKAGSRSLSPRENDRKDPLMWKGQVSIGRGLPSGSGMLINEYKTAYLTVQEGEDYGFYLSQETFYFGWPFMPKSTRGSEQLQYAYETRDDDISGLYTRWFPN